MRLALIGIGTGLFAALGLTRFLSSLLFGIGAADPLTFSGVALLLLGVALAADRKSTRLNSSHSQISYAVFCLKKKNTCLAIDAAAVALQAGIFVALYLTLPKTITRMEALATEVYTKLLPPDETVRSMLTGRRL